MQFTVAVTTVAELSVLTRFESPRQLMKYLGLIPSEYSSGERRRQGSITKAGNTHARRALVEGAWAYCYPAKVRRHLQLRLDKLPKPIKTLVGKRKYGCANAIAACWPAAKTPTRSWSLLPGNWLASCGPLLKTGL